MYGMGSTGRFKDRAVSTALLGLCSSLLVRSFVWNW